MNHTFRIFPKRLKQHRRLLMKLIWLRVRRLYASFVLNKGKSYSSNNSGVVVVVAIVCKWGRKQTCEKWQSCSSLRTANIYTHMSTQSCTQTALHTNTCTRRTEEININSWWAYMWMCLWWLYAFFLCMHHLRAIASFEHVNEACNHTQRLNGSPCIYICMYEVQ